MHLLRDGSESWAEITPRRMPEWGRVNMLELSAHDPGRAFLAVTRYRMDDFRPYVLRTDDHGPLLARAAGAAQAAGRGRAKS